MDSRILFSAVALAVAVGGCATKGPPYDAGPCTGPVCMVHVTVADCRITATPERLTVRARGNVLIHWDIRTAGYTFAETDGIAMKQSSAPFSDPNRLTPTEFQLQDRAGTKGEFLYGIKVRKPDGNACPALDSFVVNEP